MLGNMDPNINDHDKKGQDKKDQVEGEKTKVGKPQPTPTSPSNLTVAPTAPVSKAMVKPVAAAPIKPVPVPVAVPVAVAKVQVAVLTPVSAAVAAKPAPTAMAKPAPAIVVKIPVAAVKPAPAVAKTPVAVSKPVPAVAKTPVAAPKPVPVTATASTRDAAQRKEQTSSHSQRTSPQRIPPQKLSPRRKSGDVAISGGPAEPPKADGGTPGQPAVPAIADVVTPGQPLSRTSVGKNPAGFHSLKRSSSNSDDPKKPEIKFYLYGGTAAIHDKIKKQFPGADASKQNSRVSTGKEEQRALDILGCEKFYLTLHDLETDIQKLKSNFKNETLAHDVLLIICDFKGLVFKEPLVNLDLAYDSSKNANPPRRPSQIILLEIASDEEHEDAQGENHLALQFIEATFSKFKYPYHQFALASDGLDMPDQIKMLFQEAMYRAETQVTKKSPRR